MTVAVQPVPHRPGPPGRWGRPRQRQRALGLVTLVAGLLIVAMTYFPTVFVVSNSLKSGRNLFTNGVFTLFTQFDFHNYALAWSGVSQPLLNTVIVACLAIVIGVGAAALGAYAFSQLKFRGKSVLFMAYIGLLLVPWTLTLIPLFLTVQKLHMFNTWWALVLPYAASAQPLLVLLFRGFFDQIPAELLQSARVDGCSERQVLLRIVAPLTRPILLTGTILVAINVWGDYLWPTIVIQDPHRTTVSAGLAQFVASFGTNLSNSGAVFAAYVIVTAPMFLLVGFTMRYFVSGLTEGALKL
jgi:multiple sugar transport system permease protein